MDAAVGIALDKLGNRRILTERLDELDLVFGKVANTVMTPCSGSGTAPEISAPNAVP
jgi:hypothetical protein